MKMVSWMVVGFVWVGMASSSTQAQQLAQHVAADGAREASVMIRPVTVALDGVTLRQAIHAVAQSAAVRVQYQAELIDAATTRVNFAVKQVPLRAVLSRVLSGTPLEAVTSGENLITIRLSEAGMADARQFQGTIVGKVTHAKTRQPVAGATVSVATESRSVQTGADGSFRLSLSPGEHTIRVQMIGFVRSAQAVVVKEGQATTIDIVLEPSASVLDEVVVTGTVIATERKAIPNPITIITAEEIERRGITRVEQLLRGEVPGVIALEVGTRRYSNTISTSLSSTSTGAMERSDVYVRGKSSLEEATNPLKTFVDGIELLDPNYLGTIDPKSIERIEIITGPQAATIYGSGAMGGVMQIFTKHGNGGDTPDISASIKYGVLQNNFSSGLTPSHDHSVTVNGGTGPAFSYSATGSHTYSGQWLPQVYSRRFGGSMGMTHVRGPFSISGSASFSSGSNGTSSDPVGQDQAEAGLWTDQIKRPPSQLVNRSSSQTIGIKVDFQQAPWLQHHLTFGKSNSKFMLDPSNPGFFWPPDSLFVAATSSGDRTSLSYNSTLSSPREGHVTSTLTLGATASWASQTAVRACLATHNASSYISCGWLFNVDRLINSDSWGGFGNWRIGLFQSLYVTAGLRAERNPSYGTAHKIDWTPTNGITYVIERDHYTVKFLASYGRATRAPSPDRRLEQFSRNQGYEPERYTSQYANPNLTPEYSRGPQGGMEIYISNHGSVTINYYSQKITDLMQRVVADSVWQLNISTGDMRPRAVMQWRNVATIRQYGWETTGSLNIKMIHLKGTYSWADSRVLKVNPMGQIDCGGYLCSGSITPGMMFAQIPGHTGNVTAGYAQGGSSVTIVANIIGASLQSYGAGGLSAAYYNSRINTYVERALLPTNMTWASPGYVKADLALSQRLSPRVSATVNVTNIGNQYDSDINGFWNPSLGRQTLLGLSVRYPGNR